MIIRVFYVFPGLFLEMKRTGQYGAVPYVCWLRKSLNNGTRWAVQVDRGRYRDKGGEVGWVEGRVREDEVIECGRN